MPILALRVAVSIVVVIVSTVLPWLPGKYDSLAVPLLVLFATIWLAAERWGAPAGVRRAAAVGSLVTASIVAAASFSTSPAAMPTTCSSCM